jgi:DNA-binding MarR family transcriptional regulator
VLLETLNERLHQWNPEPAKQVRERVSAARPRGAGHGVYFLDNSFLVNYCQNVKTKDRQLTSSLESHAGFWLRFVSNHVSHAFARKLGTTGVTVAEWVILRELFDTGETSPSRLAASTGLTRGAVSKLVDRLLHKDLVTRVEAEGDRRFQDVKMTATGRALVPKLAALADQNDEEFFSQLSARERESLVATLKKLVLANKLKQIPTT